MTKQARSGHRTMALLGIQRAVRSISAVVNTELVAYEDLRYLRGETGGGGLLLLVSFVRQAIRRNWDDVGVSRPLPSEQKRQEAGVCSKASDSQGQVGIGARRMERLGKLRTRRLGERRASTEAPVLQAGSVDQEVIACGCDGVQGQVESTRVGKGVPRLGYLERGQRYCAAPSTHRTPAEPR